MPVSLDTRICRLNELINYIYELRKKSNYSPTAIQKQLNALIKAKDNLLFRHKLETGEITQLQFLNIINNIKDPMIRQKIIKKYEPKHLKIQQNYSPPLRGEINMPLEDIVNPIPFLDNEFELVSYLYTLKHPRAVGIESDILRFLGYALNVEAFINYINPNNPDGISADKLREAVQAISAYMQSRSAEERKMLSMRIKKLLFPEPVEEAVKESINAELDYGNPAPQSRMNLYNKFDKIGIGGNINKSIMEIMGVDDANALTEEITDKAYSLIEFVKMMESITYALQ